jgi:hypothetical protein
MPDVPGPGGGPHPHLPPTTGLDRTAAEAALEPESPAAHRVGWGFISLYTLAYISTSLVFIAPLLVTLALKVSSLVGIKRAPGKPGACHRDRRPAGHVRQSVLRQDERPHLVAAGHAAAVDGHRPGGRFSRHPRGRVGPQHRGGPRRMVPRPAVLQRTARRHGGGAARPGPGRSTRPGRRCPGGLYTHRVGERHLSWSSCSLATSSPGSWPRGDRRVFHPALRSHAERPPASQGGQARLVNAGIRQHILCQSARKNPDFAWAFVSRFMFVLAYAFLVTYQACYLLERSAAPRPRYRSRYSWAHSSSPSPPPPLPSSAASSLTERADGRSSCSPRRSCTAWRCS